MQIQKEQREFIDEIVEKRAAELLSEKEENQVESEKSMENELIELNEKLKELENANKILKEEIETHENVDEDEFPD